MATDLELPEDTNLEEEHVDTERQPSPRDKMMAEIAARAEEQRQLEIAKGLEYEQEAREAGLLLVNDETEEEPETLEAEPPRHDERQEEHHQEPPRPQMRTINYEGQQLQVTEQQYDELARMGMIANAALYQYQTQAQAPQALQPQPVQQPTQHHQHPLVDPDLVSETVRKIQFGGEQEGTAALSRLVSDVVSRVPQQPAINQDQIAQQAALYAQQQAKYARDAEIIRQEYGDTIFSDQQRTMLARINVDAIKHANAAAGIYRDDLDVFREAGNRVLDALNLPRPNSQDQTAAQAAQRAAPPPRQGIVERKRAAPKQTTQIDRRSAPPTTPRAPTASEIIDRMRQSRGQVSMM